VRILFIATLLPPYSGSGNIRALNYINYLNKLGHEIDVIGVDYPKDSVQYDASLENVFDKGINIYRINPGRLYNLFYQKKSLPNQRKKNKESNRLALKPKLNTFIRENFLLLDSYVQWIKPAFKQALHLINQNHYDCIFSMHETPSSHIVAYKIKKVFPNLRWVGYWSDPWNGDSLRRKRPFLKSMVEEKLEEKVVKAVDKLLFTTESTREFYIEKYKLTREKTHIVYRGYDINIYNEIRDTESSPLDLIEEKINIVHTGAIYRDLRDIRPLCDALERLKTENKRIFDKINIIFIGKFDNEEDQNKLKEFSNVTVKNQIPYKEALKYIVFSDVLLLYGNKNSTQVPGKVYEYLGSNAIILTILGDENDELGILMSKVKKGPIVINEAESILKAFKSIYYGITEGNLNSSWTKIVNEYEWLNVARDLEKKIIN
jgi:glycosyltransferase involved in cell wall biosynthesis